MQIAVRKKKRIRVVDIAGRLALGEGDGELRVRFGRLMDDGDNRFVFNLNGLTVMDSAGVGEIVACYQMADDRGVVIKIALAPEGPIRKVFRFTGLDKALEVFDDEDSAVASF